MHIKELQGSGVKCKLPPDYYAACKRICAKLILYLLAALLLPLSWHPAMFPRFSRSLSLHPEKQWRGK